MDPKITRAALGSTASLGDLYDARRDDFCEISIFNKEISKNAITIHDASSTDFKYIRTDNFSEKAFTLSVNAELQVSVLANLLSLKGSGKYLSDQKTSARAIKSSLLYNIKTKDEDLNIFHHDLKGAFALDAIQSGLATHVLVGISWGANTILSCSYENKEHSDTHKIEGSLEALLQKVSFNINGGTNAPVSEEDVSRETDFEIQVYGDIRSNENLPTTIRAAQEFMKKLPTLVDCCNGGKGKPLTYRFLALSVLQPYLNISIHRHILTRRVHEASLSRVVHLFQEMSSVQQTFNDFYQDVLDYAYCVETKNLENIRTLKREIDIQEATQRDNLSQALLKMRSKNCDGNPLEGFIKMFQSDKRNPANVIKKLEGWAPLKEKIKLARLLVENGARYIGYGMKLDDEMDYSDADSCYILYFISDAKERKPLRWKQNLQIFLKTMKTNTKNSTYFAVDCDIHPKSKPEKRLICIKVMQEGLVVVKDWLKEQKVAKIPLVQLVPGHTVRVLAPPSGVVPLEIRCTGVRCNPHVEYEWTCAKCQKKIDYDVKGRTHIYCDCGETPVDCLEFRCTDPKHGVIYEPHDPPFLSQLLSRLRPFTNLNILLLGETGVGKSSWINGFVNCLMYDSVEKAEVGELITVVPSEINIQGSVVHIPRSVSYVDNEMRECSTQKSQVYKLLHGKTTIRLIDTPGMGDVEQDRENFQNVLATLSHFDEIHGICIFLRSNCTQPNVRFVYCIQELLTYFHRKAKDNILFCFTHCRKTLHRPGDALPVLLKLLAKKSLKKKIATSPNNVYCFDSEGYQYLAVRKYQSSVQFSEAERLNYTESWNVSYDATKRMLSHFRSVNPHSVQDTLSLNRAREVMLSIAGSEPIHKMEKRINMQYKAERSIVSAINRILSAISIQPINYAMLEWADELREVDEALSICIRFVKENAVTFLNKATKEYLQDLINGDGENCTRDRSDEGTDGEMGTQSYRKKLELFEEKNNVIRQRLKNITLNISPEVKPEDVEQCIYLLRRQKHTKAALFDVLGLVKYNGASYNETSVKFPKMNT